MNTNFDFTAPLYADLLAPVFYDEEPYFEEAVPSSSGVSGESTTNAQVECKDDGKCDHSKMEPETLPDEIPLRRSSRIQSALGSKSEEKLNTKRSPRSSSKLKCSMPREPMNHRRSISFGGEIPNKINKIRKSPSRKSPRINRVANVVEVKKKEFKFGKERRFRRKSEGEESTASVQDFAKMLRSRNKTGEKVENSRGPTKVKAFHLHESKKKEPIKPFVSLAELNLKFFSKTPERFRSKAPTSVLGLQPKKKSSVTIAHTPHLMTRLRKRSKPQCPTREELEEKELQDAKTLFFKAHPLDRRIFEEPKMEVKEKRPCTIPIPFDIKDSQKEAECGNLMDICEEMNATGSSLASSAAHGGVAIVWKKKRTKLRPFSFDWKDKESRQKKKEKILMILEEEKKKAEFHAQLMPLFDDGWNGLPEKKVRSPTKVRPFNLRSDTRGEVKQEEIRQELEERSEMEAGQRKFKAQSDAVLRKEPFVPEKSKKPLTDVSGAVLNTERRSEERAQFDFMVKRKEDEVMAMKREAEDQRRAEEEAQIAAIRRRAVHKAQPIRKFKPVEIKHGLLPPTQPISPDFVTATRMKTRSASQHSLNSTSSE